MTIATNTGDNALKIESKRHNPQVLIVDDEATNRLVLAAILAEQGYVLHETNSGEEALRFVDLLVPDLILLDIIMPGINGYEVCRQMRMNEATAQIPIIFITALNDPENLLEGFRAGAVDYLTKPFHEAEVIARVGTHLQLKMAQDHLRAYSENLEQIVNEEARELIKAERQAAFGQLIQGIVHNMKSPLTAIRAGSQTALATVRSVARSAAENENSDLTPPLQCVIRSLEIIEAGTKRLSQMINMMMARSHLGHNQEVKVVDFNSLVKDELSFLDADLFFKHKIKKEITFADCPLPTRVVPGEMAQVLANLVNNAIDAMHGTDDPRLRIETRKNEGSAQLIIADNGCGINEDNIKQIFDPLFTTKPRSGTGDVFRNNDGPTGTGLGLYMCQHSIEAAGGTIEASSVLGKGTTFTVSIPLCDPSTCIDQSRNDSGP